MLPFSVPATIASLKCWQQSELFPTKTHLMKCAKRHLKVTTETGVQMEFTYEKLSKYEEKISYQKVC
jgi:hypothetical protein